MNECFWHRCPRCALPLPRNNRGFWERKFERNIERDRRNIAELEDDGWTVVVVWECEIRKEPDEVMVHIESIDV